MTHRRHPQLDTGNHFMIRPEGLLNENKKSHAANRDGFDLDFVFVGRYFLTRLFSFMEKKTNQDYGYFYKNGGYLFQH